MGRLAQAFGVGSVARGEDQSEIGRAYQDFIRRFEDRPDAQIDQLLRAIGVGPGGSGPVGVTQGGANDPMGGVLASFMGTEAGASGFANLFGGGGKGVGGPTTNDMFFNMAG